MIQIQRLIGMRPREVTKMRGCDIDRSGPVWVRAINFAIKQAIKANIKVSHWRPGQLRHSRGTENRKAFNKETRL